VRRLSFPQGRNNAVLRAASARQKWRNTRSLSTGARARDRRLCRPGLKEIIGIRVVELQKSVDAPQIRSYFVLSRKCAPRPICSEARLVYAFDTLGYSKRLRDAGVPQLQAEAHAEAAGEFVMAELVTKTDIQTLTTHFDTKLDNLSLRLTIRLGVMLVAGISILAAVIKLP
jgi:hypothetical protein